MICLPSSLLDLPAGTPAKLVRDSDPWSSLPSCPLPAESSNFQRLGLSYPIWAMGLAGLAPRLRSIAASFSRVREVNQGRIQNRGSPKGVLKHQHPPGALLGSPRFLTRGKRYLLSACYFKIGALSLSHPHLGESFWLTLFLLRSCRDLR